MKARVTKCTSTSTSPPPLPPPARHRGPLQPAAAARTITVGVLSLGSPRYTPRRVVVSRDSPRLECDGGRNIEIYIGSGRRSVIPYVLCSGLYSLRCCSMFWRGPCPPLYSQKGHSYMESPSRVLLESYSNVVR